MTTEPRRIIVGLLPGATSSMSAVPIPLLS